MRDRQFINRIIRIVKKFDDQFLYGSLTKIVRKIRRKTDFFDADKYVSQTEEYLANSLIREQLQNVDPKGLLCAGRLDVIVRYLLFRDIVYGKISKEHKSLYCRTILTRTGAVEPVGFFSEENKRGIEAHIQSAERLCESIKKDGFKKEHYIPIADDFSLYNGAHRLACAMALDKNVWIRKCGNCGIQDMNFRWFCDNGFSFEDKIRILRGFADICHDCGIFVLYSPVKDKWKYIERFIGRRMQIVGMTDMDFTKDYVAFTNLIHEIYHEYDKTSCIEEKITLLKFAELKLRIILVSNEGGRQKDLYENIRNTKIELRNLLNYDCAEGAYVTLHGSDSREEFDEMKQILLSVNNLRHLGMRVNYTARKKFMDWIRDFKAHCQKYGIDTDDTCIVGSSPLEVMGIRDSTDIDIVVSAELRKVYGDGISHLTPTLDIATRDYVRNGDKILIKDEQLIYDDNYHFMFMGCKFANIECILYRKSFSKREKDVKDVKLIKIFMEYTKNFDDKKVLQEQIQRELERRKISRKKSFKNRSRM